MKLKKNISLNKKKLSTFISLGFIIITLGMFLTPAIPQDVSYHDFADQKTILHIPHFWNVISNLGFIFVGFFGLSELQKQNLKIIKEFQNSYYCFFTGVFLIGIGSGYYHLSPDNNTLVWDRLPMTIAFMALFSIVIAEFIDLKLAKLVFIPLLILGLLSVFYWAYTEHQGAGDLRFYALVQFLPLILLPFILWIFPSRFTDADFYWYFLGLYFLAKLFEFADEFFYHYFVLSGHSIKHLLASVGCYVFLYQLKKRSFV